jgi:hypothetical protein
MKTATETFVTILRAHEGTNTQIVVVLHSLPAPLTGTVTSVGDEVVTLRTKEGHVTVRLEYVMLVGEPEEARIAKPQISLA